MNLEMLKYLIIWKYSIPYQDEGRGKVNAKGGTFWICLAVVAAVGVITGVC